MPTNGLLPPDVGEIHGEADDGEEEVQVAAPRLPLSVFCSNMDEGTLKVHKIENFFGSEFEFILFYC